MKKALTFTMIAGSRACTNDCPICISKMTPAGSIGSTEPEVDWTCFGKAVNIALNHGAENALITGKGEPLMFPAQVTKYLHQLEGKSFDRREIQTEGSLLMHGGRLYDEFLKVWKDLGLDVIAPSIYHYDSGRNKEMFRPRSGRILDLPRLIEKINSNGFRTRLSCALLDGFIDSAEEVGKLIEFARANGVFQLTLRKVDAPRDPIDKETAAFVRSHAIGYGDERYRQICSLLDREGRVCDVLPHGAKVYEINGQNVCITTGLSTDPGVEEIRQLIFFPPDIVTTSWENIHGGRIL